VRGEKYEDSRVEVEDTTSVFLFFHVIKAMQRTYHQYF
jgi:hypothetical protein